MITAHPKNKLAQLVKAERNISAFQRLSNIHEHTLTEHNDQLEFTWRNGYDTGTHDARNIYRANEEANLLIKKNLKHEIETFENQNTDLSLQVVTLKHQLTDQAKRHQKRIEELTADLEASTAQFALSTLTTEPDSWVVKNWRKGWLWLSNWVFAAIGYIAVFGIPPEVMALLPVESQTKVIAVLSVLGMILRFVNQSKPKPLPELKGGLDDFAA